MRAGTELIVEDYTVGEVTTMEHQDVKRKFILFFKKKLIRTKNLFLDLWLARQAVAVAPYTQYTLA